MENKNLSYDKFLDTESLDINLILGGSSSIVIRYRDQSTQDTFVTMITNSLTKNEEIV